MSADDQMKRLSMISSGRTASAFLDYVDPFLAEIEASILSALKNMARSGLQTEAKLLAGVAQLCTLDDIRSKLKAKINAMHTTIKQEEKLNE